MARVSILRFGDCASLKKGRYAGSRILGEIYRIAGNISGAEYALCAAYAALAVAHLAGLIAPALLLGRRNERALVCGFHDGDYVIVGTITTRGFCPAQQQPW